MPQNRSAIRQFYDCEFDGWTKIVDGGLHWHNREVQGTNGQDSDKAVQSTLPCA